MKQITFKLFQSLSVSELERMAAERNYETDFMMSWIKFTARMAKQACAKLRKALKGFPRNKSCTSGELATTPRGIKRTVYPLGYDMNAATSDRKSIRFHDGYSRWRMYLIDLKFTRIALAIADRIDDEIGMENVLHSAQKVLTCRR